MKKVSSELLLKKKPDGKSSNFRDWEIFLPNSLQLKHDLLAVFIKTKGATEIMLDIEVKNPFTAKTKPQLGYLHAAIFKPFYKYYKEAGLDYSEEQIRMQLKYHPEINFVDELYDPFDGNSQRIAKSVADASKFEVMQFIDRLIRFAASVGLVIEEPDVYRLRNGIKKEDWEKWSD